MTNYAQWDELIARIKPVLLETGMQETIKWGIPVFTFKGKNIVGIAPFKNHLAIWFYQGVLLKDSRKLLINAQEGKTKALRQWKIHPGEIPDLQVLKQYVEEAIKNEQLGKHYKPERDLPLELPDLLKTHLDADSTLKVAFEKLSPSKQKDYVLYISEAKREETRQQRMMKIIPMIKMGKGLNDRYL